MKLEELIGNRTAINIAKRYFETDTEKGAMLFTGQYGVGKTTLAHALGEHYGYQCLEKNAASERRKKDIQQLGEELNSTNLDGKEPLLIMDEADSLKDEVALMLIQKPIKVIFTVNDQSLFRHRKKCHRVAIQQPTLADYDVWRKRILLMAMPSWRAAVVQFQSWRDVYNWRNGGEPRGALSLNDREEAQKIFSEGWNENWDATLATRRKKQATGNHNFIADGPQTLLEYFYYNGGDPSLTSELDILMKQEPVGRGVAVDVLHQQRLAEVKKPWYYFKKGEKEERYSRDRLNFSVKGFIPI